VRPEYEEAAGKTGRYLAGKGIGLVYGGGAAGLMGTLARACKDNGGNVTGVIPRKIYDNVSHIELDFLHIVETMHERKRKMSDLSDAFLALPGGFGTFEEIFEAVAWLQLGYHSKPCALYNVCGYYDPLQVFLKNCLSEGFLRREHYDLLFISDSLEAIFSHFRHFRHEYVSKWA